MATENKTRVPVEVNGIQHNFCKNPKCVNFGVPAAQEKNYGSSTYRVTGKNHSGTTNIPQLKCNGCGEHLPMKSNKGIYEERERLLAYLTSSSEQVSCSDPGCVNHTVAIPNKKAYRSYGKAASGARRYLCKGCGKTVSVARPTQWQHETHKNIDIFKLLTNKVALSRIIAITEVSWEVLYNRINFIHAQCVKFAAHREAKLATKHFERLYLSTDRQEYSVNWTDRKDKRNVVLTAVATADNSTGYVFGIHPNFDPSANKATIEADALIVNDAKLASPFRKYARLWLEHDYVESAQRNIGKQKVVTGSLISDIKSTYNQAQARIDIEAFDEKDEDQKLPEYGMQTKGEYTMIAHFHFIKKLCGNVDKWRFFLDQDSGIRSAFFSAFTNETKAVSAEAFFVRIEKSLTVDQKRRIKSDAMCEFDHIAAMNPGYSESDIKLEMLKNTIAAAQNFGKWNDRWIKHPLPDMAEANKALCWLTEHDNFHDEIVENGITKKVVSNHVAWLYQKASLHGVDNFFQKLRRRVMMLERPIHSASNAGRTWNGYGAYNPAMITKLLEIFRVVHNYIDISKTTEMVAGKKKTTITTPAMKLGLAAAPIDFKDILYMS